MESRAEPRLAEKKKKVSFINNWNGPQVSDRHLILNTPIGDKSRRSPAQPLTFISLRQQHLICLESDVRPPVLLCGQVVYYLSGLTCTDDNFIQKAGAQRMAAVRGVALVAPDTSPRGSGIEGEVGGGECVLVFLTDKYNDD